jgi:hypothetical protein
VQGYDVFMENIQGFNNTEEDWEEKDKNKIF